MSVPQGAYVFLGAFAIGMPIGTAIAPRDGSHLIVDVTVDGVPCRYDDDLAEVLSCQYPEAA